MTQYSMKFPEGFILGAAASAWQTEGWSGKKDSQDSYIDAWYKNDRKVWHNAMGQLSRLISTTVMLKILTSCRWWG